MVNCTVCGRFLASNQRLRSHMAVKHKTPLGVAASNSAVPPKKQTEQLPTAQPNMARLKKNINILKVLHDCNRVTREEILKVADQDLIDTICECMQNILKGKIKISKHLLKKMKQHQSAMEKIQSKKTEISRQKQLLIQNGGFLPPLIAPLLGTQLGIDAGASGGLNEAFRKYERTRIYKGDKRKHKSK